MGEVLSPLDPSPFGEEDSGELSAEATDELSAECDGDCVKGEGVCSVMSASRATSGSLVNLTDLCPDPTLISENKQSRYYTELRTMTHTETLPDGALPFLFLISCFVSF